MQVDPSRHTSRPGGRLLKVSTAVTLLALGGALAAAVPLQWTWWRTARQTSLELVNTFSAQISDTARNAWWDRVSAAEASFRVAARLLGPDPHEQEIQTALQAAQLSSRVPTALSFARPGEAQLVLSGMTGQRVQNPADSVIGTIGAEPGWHEAPDPVSGSPAVVYAGPVGGGTLAIYLAIEQVSLVIGTIPVGRTGAAFVIGPEGRIIVAPHGGPGEHLLPVARLAGAEIAARPRSAVNVVESRRLTLGPESFQVAFSPIEYKGWQFVVILPEQEFLGEIDRTMRQTVIGLVALVVALGLIATLIAHRVLSRPVSGLMADLGRIERFEVEDIGYRPAHLMEFDRLSAAMVRMSTGLADFAKFIPTDLVRLLLASGMRAAPGGDTREITLLFADVADFTTISERMGTKVIEIVSRYLDVMSGTIEARGGTIDKFIGDAVMAFWGAPLPDAAQARNACLAAIDAIAALEAAGIRDDRGEPLRIRVGIHSGPAVVGNIGSARRLNYTAVGDTVNLASRLEGVNKVFGTQILISETTRQAMGPGFRTREIVDIAVVGKTNSIRVHELRGRDDGETPAWLEDYAAALAAYRRRDFAGALERLDAVLAAAPLDGPSLWLRGLCESLIAAPPPEDWRGVAVLSSK